MPLIKRYPNRKLYDTVAKRYITLDQIADLIREGEEVHVVDNTTGEDLTTVTLTQIIFEQEKKQGGFLPRPILSSLIRAGGDRINALQRTLATSIGLWHQVDEEIQRRVETLINLGDLEEEEGRILIKKLIMLGGEREEPSRSSATQISMEELERYLIDRNLPTRDDLQHLLDELDQLSAEIDEVKQAVS